MKPIQTNWAGYRFRSRLEARWAVFFSNLGVEWEYEPEGFELSGGVRYLPDFLVRYREENLWCEVKPRGAMDQKDMEKLTKFAAEVADIVLLDGPPAPGGYVRFTADQIEDPDLWREVALRPEFREWSEILWSRKDRNWGGDSFQGAFGEWGCSSLSHYLDAMNAALSARFEFGEAPAHA